MWVLNLGKPVNIPVLSQEMATELGANLLGETIIFSIAAILMLFEYNRQCNKEAAKEAAKQAEMDRITSGIEELFNTVKNQQEQLTELQRLVYIMSGKTPEPPPKGKEPPPTTKPPAGPTQGKESAPLEVHVPSSNVQKPASKVPSCPTGSNPHIDNSELHEDIKKKLPASSPNHSVILQSLDYIQADVLSFLFLCVSQQNSYDKIIHNLDT